MTSPVIELAATGIRSARLPFVVLSPVCVLLGAATASATGASLAFARLAFVLAGAVLAHLSVNWLNEYQDFRSGLDLQTIRTPFSGGSGALPDRPEAARSVLVLGVLASIGLCAVGIALVIEVGPMVIAFGLVGLLLVVFYSTYINTQPLLCLVAPGIGFGPLMVTGTHWVLTGQVTASAVLAGLTVFFLTSNLLLLNQYPDIDADRAAGRRHGPIAWGIARSNRIYAAFAVGAALSVFIGTAARVFPPITLLALIPVSLSFYAFAGARHFGADIGGATRYLAANTAAAVLTPLVLALTLLPA